MCFKIFKWLKQSCFPSKFHIHLVVALFEKILIPIHFQLKRSGTSATPPHVFNDFKLKVYAPLGFKYLRKKFSLDEADFMHSISETELKEISNPGASGSIFYKTSDDKYILKTVQYQECEFLKTLLAGIYLVN